VPFMEDFVDLILSLWVLAHHISPRPEMEKVREISSIDEVDVALDLSVGELRIVPDCESVDYDDGEFWPFLFAALVDEE
jgi:hypothetical protein